jgi:hypothetical protein
MSIQYTSSGSCSSGCGCPDKLGCPPGVCPDFVIRRHDTKPPFRIAVEECGETLPVEGLVLEMSMWAKAKLKKSITPSDTAIAFADAIGFEQAMAGDIIFMERVRGPEHMLVLGFDEDALTVNVQRGYNGTGAGTWKKGTPLRIMRIMNSPAETEQVFEDIQQIDGDIEKGVLTGSFFVYEWKSEDTCMPGCFYAEFKLIKMLGLSYYLPGGHWDGDFHEDGNGYFLTGTAPSDGAVVLSLVPEALNKFLLPKNNWLGPTHLWTDGNYYTGTQHDSASVFLNNTGVASNQDVAYTPDNQLSVIPLLDISTISVSGISEVSITPAPGISDVSVMPDCSLGTGIEWIRRFPKQGEGFLIQINDTPTAE